MQFAVYLRLLLVMAGVTYLIRLLPMVIFKKKLKGRFINSFLHYVVYAVLSAMIFPYVFYSTGSLPSAAAGVLVAFAFALLGKGLISVALAGCAAAYVCGLFL